MGDDAGEERGVLKLQLPPVWSCTAAPDAAAAAATTIITIMIIIIIIITWASLLSVDNGD